MLIGVLKEHLPSERRVALVPDVVGLLVKKGFTVKVEQDAGAEAGYPNQAYTDKGASLGSRPEIVKDADILVHVQGLFDGEAPHGDLSDLKGGGAIVGTFDPLTFPQKAKALAEQKKTAFAMELMPRITRAQNMDVLSSMATVAGYKAVLLAANTLPKMFPLMMTAAGTVSPAKVFVIGAGVAGLQAIATAKRLGAVVKAYDVRPAVREQVESLGGTFVDLSFDTGDAEDKGGYAKELTPEQVRKQQELMAEVVAESDVVITTAAIPGRKAPVLVTEDMVKRMADGAVVVDLAAERGGNCELSKAGENVLAHGVNILGPVNVPSQVPFHASQMYAKNIYNFITHLVKTASEDSSPEADHFSFDPADEIAGATLIAHDGDVPNPRLRDLLSLPPLESAAND